MSAVVYPTADLELVEQVVAEPRFQRLTQLPTFALGELGILFGAYLTIAAASALYLNGQAPYPLVLAINAIAIYAIFTPLHDATHRSASGDPVVNDWIGNLAAIPLLPGFTTKLYRYLHLEHHRHTGDPERDPDDFFVAAPVPLRPFVWMFLDLHWALYYFRHRHERPIDEQRRFAGSLAFFVAWHVVGLASPWAWEFVILWLVPQRLGLVILAYLFASIQHPEGVLQDERPLQATRMMKGGRVVRWIMIGQSEHLMHHMFPALPYYRYDQAWQIAGPLFRTREIVWDWPIVPMRMPGPAVPTPTAQRIPARIAAVEDVSTEVRAYTLEPAGETPFPAFTPGAHVDVHVAPKVVRPYSIATAPRPDGRYRIGVKREESGRGGSKRAHETFAVGHVVEIGLPRNHFPLADDAREVVLLAGGIGITPLLSMAEALEARGTAFAFHVCARSRAVLPFARELETAPYASRVHLHLDDGAPEQKLAATDLPVWSKGGELYLCGPPAFLDFATALAESRGWPVDAVHTESFLARTPDRSRDRAFEVVLARSSTTLEVPADRSLLDVLQAHHVAIPASCTQGLCGACVCDVIEGDVEHRDVILGEARRRSGKMTTCVSRAAGARLVVDL